MGKCGGFVGKIMLLPCTSDMVLLVLDVKISVSCVDITLLKFGIALGKFAMSEIEKEYWVNYPNQKMIGNIHQNVLTREQSKTRDEII